MSLPDREFPGAPPRQPRAVNVPAIVVAMIAAFGLVHFVRTSVLSLATDDWVLLNFAFIPGCYGSSDPLCALREGWSPAVAFLSHAFLHGDWTHFAMNAVWLLAFGTPVARRLGVGRLLLFCAIGAVSGAALFYALNPRLLVPMIGASGVVSALMGGACRFALGGMGRPLGSDVARAPLLSIRRSLADRTVLFFIVVFFLTNIALGSGAALLLGGAAIAWEAHVGGFLFGFLAFAAFDPRRQHAVDLAR